MQMPDVRNTLRDEKHTCEEMLSGVRLYHYHAQPKVRRRKTPLRNLTITILTVHGATPNL